MVLTGTIPLWLENLPVDSCLLGPQWVSSETSSLGKLLLGVRIQEFYEVQGYEQFRTDYLEFTWLFGLAWFVAVLNTGALIAY